jgi:hypothetical protein
MGCEAAIASEYSLDITTDDRASDENTANATSRTYKVRGRTTNQANRLLGHF